MLRMLTNLLGGGILETGRKILGMFIGDRADRERGYHDESMESHRQFAAEFGVRNRTWLDSVIDAFNRLPRPIIVTMVITYFWYSYHDPLLFAILNESLDTIPDLMWQIAIIIISFYFVAREIQKSRDKSFSMKASELAAKMDRMKELQSMRTEAVNDPPMTNEAIAEWNKKRGNSGDVK
jgi:hypothetical protein